MLESEGVGDPLATCISHEDSNATIVICGMQSVPCLGCMTAPCASTIWFHVQENLLCA
jgi:hypothetical protein